MNPQKNNFDLVRLVLAWIVVFVHTAILSGSTDLFFIRQILSSSFAVKGFFTISGYLVTQSYLNSRDISDYFIRRFWRIVPPYVAIVLLCYVVGSVISPLPIVSYIFSLQSFKFLLANLSFLNFIEPKLPGVFTGHVEEAVNISLWTIKVEIGLYLCIPFIVYAFRRINPLAAVGIMTVASMVWYLGFTNISTPTNKFGEVARQFPGQLSFFAIGAFLAFAKIKPLSLTIVTTVSGLVFFTLFKGPYQFYAEPVFFSCFVVFLATVPKLRLNAGRFGDLSYSTYLIHAPIIQLFVYLEVFALNHWLGLAAVVLTVFCLSVLSWRFVEKPLLRRTKIST
jgi:peptidoglycan/LPS O-acetylase OafA/YrhL